MPYADRLRADILALMKGVGDRNAVARALTLVHVEAIEKLRTQAKEEVRLVGFHGQTIRHAPKQGITVQIGEAQAHRRENGPAVIADFRSNDIKNGGRARRWCRSTTRRWRARWRSR